MRKALIIALTCAAMTLTLVPSASAGHDDDFYVGAGFRIGKIHFNIALGHDGYGRPHYYYRSQDRVRYRDHSCTSACFKSDRYYYHSQDCPVARFHFQRNHQDMRYVFQRYAPRYDAYGNNGYRGDYDRGDYYRDDHRRDRYRDNDRRGRDQRYERPYRGDRHRGRGYRQHRHGRYQGSYDRCPHRHH